MKVLVIDLGGTNVKLLASGEKEPRKFPSGPSFTPDDLVAGVQKAAIDWKYDAIAIGFPGPVVRGRLIAEPYNLGPGWVHFDFEKGFGKPVKLINDAAMQALGSYEGGRMLFLGLGTGLGSAMIVDGLLEPMELGHLPYKKATFEDYVGIRGLDHFGKKKWREHVADVVAHFFAALEPDYIVLGGGNVKKLKELPEHTRAGSNENAFRGGFLAWKKNGTAIDAPRQGRNGRVPKKRTPRSAP